MEEKIVVTQVNSSDSGLRCIFIELDILKNWILKTADYVIRVCDYYSKNGKMPEPWKFNRWLESEGQLVVELYYWAEVLFSITRDFSTAQLFTEDQRKFIIESLRAFDNFQKKIRQEDEERGSRRYGFFSSFYEKKRPWRRYEEFF